MSLVLDALRMKSATHPSGYAQKTVRPGSLRGKGGGLARDYLTESGQHNVSEPIQLSGRARRTRTEETQDKTKEQQRSRAGPVNLFCMESDGKYLNSWRPYALCCSYSVQLYHCSVKAAIDNTVTHKQGCSLVKRKLYLQSRPDLANGPSFESP